MKLAPLGSVTNSFKSSNVNPLFEENNKDAEIKSSSFFTLTSPEVSELEAYLEKDLIPPGIDLTLPPTFKVSSSNPTSPTLTGEKDRSKKISMFFSLIRFVWRMMYHVLIRRKILCLLATYLHKKSKPPQEVQKVEMKDNEILPHPLLDSDSPLMLELSLVNLKENISSGTLLVFKEPSFLLPPPEPPDECLKNVVLNFYQNQKTFPLNVEDVNSFTFIIWTFLPHFTYSKESPLIFSFRSENFVFDPGIITFHNPVAVSMKVSICSP
ncbi:hypothetical protein Tco_1164405 [Tanacetum coccineum]